VHDVVGGTISIFNIEAVTVDDCSSRGVSVVETYSKIDSKCEG
jgi:hypothetical protein